jgi:threonine dehydrogenase-like Zn-dependent dehydrogenase
MTATQSGAGAIGVKPYNLKPSKSEYYATVVVVGGGWSGCSAALAAKKAGAEKVILLERTDGLLGTGLVGGIMRNNGRWTAQEESMAMGMRELYEVCDETARHHNVDFPGHKHATFYDVAHIEGRIRRKLVENGVEVWLISRVINIHREGTNLIRSVTLENGTTIRGDVFIDCTGTVGSQSYCTEHGNGCVMCIVRCPTYGPRVSMSSLLGIPERQGKRADGGVGAMSGSCKLSKTSINSGIMEEMEGKGWVAVPIPQHLIHEEKLAIKACQQYALKEYAHNLVLLDTGQVKLMTSFIPLDQLRQVPGFEDVRYEDPYAGSIGNSMRYAAISPHDDNMHVRGPVDNLFCGGEKAGLLVGHTEAMTTGSIAGNNAVRYLAGAQPLTIPRSLAIGDGPAYCREAMDTSDGMTKKYTYSGSVYFQRMKAMDLYVTDVDEIQNRVRKAGMENIFNEKVL